MAPAWLYVDSPLYSFLKTGWSIWKRSARVAESVEGSVQKMYFSKGSSDSFDLIVIGGGPAGTMAALSAQRKGVRTLLLEREDEIGGNVICAEAVTFWIFRDFLNWNPDWVSAKITGVAMRRGDWRVFRVGLSHAAWILDRQTFDRDLGQTATNAGATLLTGALASGLVLDDGLPVGVRAQVKGKERHYFAPMIIGADGISSTVVRWAGLDTALDRNEVTSCSQMRIRSEEICEDIVEFVFGREVAPGGYAWVFPKGNQTANVGLGVCPTHSTKKAKDFLCDFVEWRFRKATVLDQKAGGIPSVFTGSVARENVLLCGDAARVCHPLTGGGIYNAAATGSLAGDVVAERKMNKMARRYTAQVMRKFGFELRLGDELRKIYLQLSEAELREVWEFGVRRFSGKTISIVPPLRTMGLFLLSHPRYLKHVPRLARAGLQMSNMT